MMSHLLDKLRPTARKGLVVDRTTHEASCYHSARRVDRTTHEASSYHSGRRGQTLVIALAILFLLVLLGAIFVVMVIKNLQRVTRHTATDDSLTLAIAGLQYAAQQFQTSEEGADWRPRTGESLWKTPAPRNAAEAALRLQDPDHTWLDPNSTGGRPYTRVQTGEGRSLLRVTFLPAYRPASGASVAPDEFDRNSMTIHLEAVGRPGTFDPKDPTSFEPTTVSGPGNIKGPFRKVDAFVPLGLVDQLWWITNHTKERGPAELGIPPFRDGTGQLVEYTTVYHGPVRSNTDLQLQGRVIFRFYPARGEDLSVKGNLRVAQRGNVAPGAPAQVEIQALDDNNQTIGATIHPTYGAIPTIPPDNLDDNPTNDVIISRWNPGQSQGSFNPGPMANTGQEVRFGARDDRYSRGDTGTIAAQSVRADTAPRLDQDDPNSGILRYLRLSRDSGETRQVTDTDGSGTRLINTGWYGLSDWYGLRNAGDNPASDVDDALRPERARGIYLDNFGDLQYPRDRRAVKQEWLRQGSPSTWRRSWIADHYIPTVVEENVTHPIAEIVLTEGRRDPREDDPNYPNPRVSPIMPKIRIIRYDLDTRQLNAPGATGRLRQFHVMDPVTNDLIPVGQTRDFEYPPNGVLFCHGSVRIRGIIGGTGGLPKQLTVVSGGSIYIEGNIIKGHPASFLGLLAQDYVVVNPTVFTRINPGSDVVVEADTFGPNGEPLGYHYNVPQGSDLDFSFTTGRYAGGVNPDWLVHVKHTAPAEDASSNTELSLYLPSLLPAKYDFQANLPPDPAPSNNYAPGSQLFYLFQQISAGAPNNWAESNYQTAAGSPANFERKSWFLPGVGGSSTITPIPGRDESFRMVVGESIRPNAQPYWLSRLAVVPQSGPLAIQIEAVCYAYTGSWFVIPPPFFNENENDTRQNYVASGLTQRAQGTFPNDTDHHPFYNEALNVEIDVIGAVTENMPAEPNEKSLWTNRTWVFDSGYDPGAFPLLAEPAFRPNMRFHYDPLFRRLVRVRFQRPYAAHPAGPYTTEEMAWAGPGASQIPVRLLAVVAAEALANNTYFDTLPVLPKLPATPLVYEGNPL